MRVIRVTADVTVPDLDEATGIRRFFVRAPGGSVLNIAQHHDPDE